MICLDSTFIIDFLRNEKSAVKKAEEIKDKDVVTTTVNVFEVALGVHSAKDSSEAKMVKFMELAENLDILDFDTESSFRASKIASDLIRSGKMISAMDCLIAGTMLSNGCTEVITKDRSHFGRISGITVSDY